MKILVVAPSWIGDVVMSQCLYKTIKQLHPDSIIHVLAPKWCLPVLNRMPEVDRAILMPIGHGSFAFKERVQLGKSFALTKYDEAYILPNSWKSALIPYFANIKKRTGWKGECRYFLINDLRSNKENFPLLVERYTALAYPKSQMQDNKCIPEILIPSLKFNAELSEEVKNKLNIDTSKNFLGLCPGAEYGPTKKWPVEYYAEFSNEYLKTHENSEILIFGSNKDLETANEILNFISDDLKNRVNILAGKTSIEEAIDLLALCKLVICNDSGLMHISAGVGTKLIAIFGSTSTKYTPPQSKDALIIESTEPCHPCFKKQCKFQTMACLKGITPQYVIEKMKERWPNL